MRAKVNQSWHPHSGPPPHTQHRTQIRQDYTPLNISSWKFITDNQIKNRVVQQPGAATIYWEDDNHHFIMSEYSQDRVQDICLDLATARVWGSSGDRKKLTDLSACWSWHDSHTQSCQDSTHQTLCLCWCEEDGAGDVYSPNEYNVILSFTQPWRKRIAVNSSNYLTCCSRSFFYCWAKKLFTLTHKVFEYRTATWGAAPTI